MTTTKLLTALSIALASSTGFLASATPVSVSVAADAAATAAAKPCLKGPPLRHWPDEAAAALNAMIAANAHQGRYAAFDMDNTSYQYDLEESLLPYLENKGVITRDSMDPSLKVVPFKDTPAHNETLYGYYLRLCEIDDAICYPFAAQIFSGIPLRQLKVYVDELMALNGTVHTSYYDGDELVKVDVNTPRVFKGQVELYNKLMANGIDVYVVSAASEELVRMVAADPKYGYNVKPENVIGVTTALRNRTTGELTSARKQVAAGTYDERANLDLDLAPLLWAPATWKTGKWAAILSYIDMWKKPVLVGGDTPDSDGPMQFHGVDVARGGVHLWVNRKDKYQKQIDQMKADFAAAQAEEGLPVTADKNWVTVKPADIL